MPADVTSKLRILHVIPSLAAEGGGPPVVCAGLAGALTARGHEVAVATVDDRASATAVRRIVYAKLFTGTGRHEIEIQAVGTPGRPRVDLDVLLVVVPIAG